MMRKEHSPNGYNRFQESAAWYDECQHEMDGGSTMMRNHEGYHDPTAGMALRNIGQKERAGRLGYMPLVYICLPNGAARNVEDSKHYCAFALSKSALPIAPCLLFAQLGRDGTSEHDRELTRHMSLILLKHCREVWFFGEVIDEDMCTVLLRAARRDMIVRRFTSDCREVDTYDLRVDCQEAES